MFYMLSLNKFPWNTFSLGNESAVWANWTVNSSNNIYFHINLNYCTRATTIYIYIWYLKLRHVDKDECLFHVDQHALKTTTIIENFIRPFCLISFSSLFIAYPMPTKMKKCTNKMNFVVIFFCYCIQFSKLFVPIMIIHWKVNMFFMS